MLFDTKIALVIRDDLVSWQEMNVAAFLQHCAKRLSYLSLLAFFNWNRATVAEPPTRRTEL